MKKSKIIVPALGILLFSTAASISGTVAWFTATRTYEADAGNFAVVSTKNNLEVEMAGELGTQLKDGDDTVIELANANYKLTDASVDAANHYLIAPDAAGTKVGKLVDLNAPAILGTAAGDTNGLFRETNIYSAFTWTIDFKLSMGSVSQTIGLFFDNSLSSVTLSDGSAVTDTGKGFRVGFLPISVADANNGSGIAKVWAPNQTGQTSSVNNVRYTAYSNAIVAGTTTLDSITANYSTGNVLMDGATATNALTVPEDGAVGATTSAVNYMGTFTFAADSVVHLKYRVVVWYEGTDPTIINTEDTVYEIVKANMHFGTARLA